VRLQSPVVTRPRRLAGILAASALAVTAVVLPPPASADAATVPVLHWGACHDPAIPSGYQCATLRVPLDGEEVGSAGPTIGLALDRRLASDRKPIGSLLVNPGGPGGSGVDALPDIVDMLSPALLDHFDVVGFDPPGVGASDPVTCLGSAALARYLDLDPAPTDAAGLAALVAGDRTFAAGCEQHSGAVLPHVSTVAAARDMDRIRAAVGDTRLTYLGFSYGTFLGATYAELYPHRVRAMVLDGALDPTLSATAEIDAQSVAIDGDLTALEASCARSSSCAWKAPAGGTLSGAFSALLARVRAHPLPAGGGRTVGPAQLLYGTAAGLYSTSTWPFVETALAQATRGQGADLLELFDSYTGRQANGTYANTVEAETAVNCLDDPVPSVTGLETAARQVEASAPVFGPLDVLSEISCSVWPVAPTGRPHAMTAPGTPPIVVVGSTGDPVTPYAWARHLAAQLPKGVLLTRVGEGHTGYGASSCVRAAVDRYLVDLRPPAAGTRCASD
jgi:pimeloyl-ACP methyl ester carboxylesterase